MTPEKLPDCNKHRKIIPTVCALFFFLLVVYQVIPLDRSGFVMMTTPDFVIFDEEFDISRNSLIGYSGSINGRVAQRENIPFYRHHSMFLGGPVATDFYVERPVYSFLTSTISTFVGWGNSFMLLNVFSWWLGVIILYLLGRDILGSSRLGFYTASLGLFGIGFLAQLHDHSAHILAFPVFFGAVLLIHKSNVWQENQSLGTHSLIGTYLLFASMQYNTGLIATLAYFLSAMRHNGVFKPGVLVVFILILKSFWPDFLNIISGKNVDYRLTEQLYRERSIKMFLEGFQHPVLWAKNYLGGMLGYVFVTAPHITVLGLVGLISLVVKKRSPDFCILVTSFYLLPIIALSFYVGFDLAKGYISFQLTAFLFIGCAFLLDKANTEKNTTTRTSIIALTLIVSVQAAWSLAYTFGYSVPIKTYFLGINQFFDAFQQPWHKPITVSLTGQETGPAIIGGSGRLMEAGFICTASFKLAVTNTNIPSAFTLRLPLAILTTIMVFGWMRIYLKSNPLNEFRGKVTLGILFFILWLLPILLNEIAPFTPPTVCSISQVSVPRDTPLRFEIDISKEFVSKLASYANDSNQLEIHHGLTAGKTALGGRNDAFLNLGTYEIRIDGTKAQKINIESAITGLRATQSISLEIPPVQTDYLIYGWQHNALPNRRLFLADEQAPKSVIAILPSIEVRVRSNKGNSPLVLLGF